MRNNALPYPIYGAPFVVTFPLLDADGDPVSPSSPDSKISKNGDTFADCTNEATEIATSSGLCYLSLTGTELTCDVATVKVASTGAKSTCMSLYPRKLVTVRSGTTQGGSSSTIQLDAGASAIDDFYNGMVCIAVIDGTTEARVIGDYTGSTKTATVEGPNWVTASPDADDTFVIKLPEGRHISDANISYVNASAVSTSTAQIGVNVVNAAGTAWGSGAITAESIASDAITAAKVADGAIDAATFAAGAINAAAIASDAITAAKIADGAIDAATFASGAITATAIASDTITAAKIAADAITAAKIADGAIDAATFAAGAITASAIAADAIGASELAADAVTEIQSGLATSSALTTVGNNVTSILADTNDIQDRLPAALVSGRMDSSVGGLGANSITATVLDSTAIDEIAAAVGALTGADPSAAPAPNATWLELLSWIATWHLNAKTVDRSNGNTVIYANDGTEDGGAAIGSMVVTDDGTTTAFTAWE